MNKRQTCIGAVLSIIILLTLALPAGVFAQGLVLEIDIKPCKEPNVLNLNQPSLLPVAIYNGSYLINESTITLNSVGATEWVYKSGYLLAKFDSQAVIATLGQVSNGDVIQLTLSGQLEDGTPFTGTDEVVILKRGR